MIPKDPVILLSFINTKLRDHYTDLEALCEDLSLSSGELRQTLGEIGYHYQKSRNQFL